MRRMHCFLLEEGHSPRSFSSMALQAGAKCEVGSGFCSRKQNNVGVWRQMGSESPPWGAVVFL